MPSDRVTLAHGSGGAVMRRFIEDLFVEAFDNDELRALNDSALLTVDAGRLAFTTDSYTIKPLEFPGGDIGKLSVAGTVNDLTVMGAKPFYLSLGCILEEGLELDRLERFVRSAANAARAAGVQIVTGDTKVVPHGECDGIFINTSGIGICPLGHGLSTQPVRDGDAVIVTGTVGDHGMAILSVRDHLNLESAIQSDCASLNGLMETVLAECGDVKWMRDATRGGVAAVLSELVEAPFHQREIGVLIEETAVPLREDVLSLCELLGFEPLHLANEGKIVLVAAAESADTVLRLLRSHELGREAAVIGQITAQSPGTVRLRTQAGGIRRLHRPAGELLPRIC